MRIQFSLMNAMDGFPMLFSLRDSFSNSKVINEIETLKRHIINFDVSTRSQFDQLNKQVTSEVRQQNFVDVIINTVKDEYYIESNFFSNLAHRTTAQHIFGNNSPLNFGKSFGYSRLSKTISNTMALSQNLNRNEQKEVINIFNVVKSLAINTTTQQIMVLSEPKDNSDHLPM